MSSLFDPQPDSLQYALSTSDLPSKDIAVLVAGAGTGGTITGLSRAARDYTAASSSKTRTTVVAVDPEGSILGGGEPGNYEVEGIGYVSIAHASTNKT
jgi:cysteine synthase